MSTRCVERANCPGKNSISTTRTQFESYTRGTEAQNIPYELILKYLIRNCPKQPITMY